MGRGGEGPIYVFAAEVGPTKVGGCLSWQLSPCQGVDKPGEGSQGCGSPPIPSKPCLLGVLAPQARGAWSGARPEGLDGLLHLL